VNAASKKSILAISQDFSARNPSGTAFLRVLNQLSESYDITCMGGTPRPPEIPACINYVRAHRVGGLGLLAGFVSFHVSHVFMWLWLTVVKRKRYDVVHTIDAESFLGHIITFHCCDRAFLKIIRDNGLAQSGSWLHVLSNAQALAIYNTRAWIEQRVCRARRTKAIIAVSSGLARDLDLYQPRVKPIVIPNALP